MEFEPGLRVGGSTGTTLPMGLAVENVCMGISADGKPEEELELGLGLSLGGGGKAKPSAWGERGRLLTAKDFPAVVSGGGSSFSAFSPKPTSDAAVSGTKRAASTDGGCPAFARQVVGWPPIRAFRMSNLMNLTKTPTTEEGEDRSDMDASDAKKRSAYGGGVGEKANGGFVKVNMDGVVIGRKVDLTSHSCYQTLAMMVEDMFLRPKSNGSSGEESGAKTWPKLLDGSGEFVLTYEDKEGDWMLVGDVPWKMFVSSVKKLRLMRTSDGRYDGRRRQSNGSSEMRGKS